MRSTVFLHRCCNLYKIAHIYYCVIDQNSTTVKTNRLHIYSRSH
ncbi:unnamed protein product, partial [Allacma fusca]